jgi:hypothetical protein
MEKLSLNAIPKAVIGVVGVKGTGKSQLLREFAQTIKWDDFKHVKCLPKNDNWRKEKKKDFFVIGDYKGVRVGIMTAGDFASMIVRTFIYIEKWECDILIIATHPEKSRSRSTSSWVALQAIVVAYGIRWHFVTKNKSSKADKERAKAELRKTLAEAMASL